MITKSLSSLVGSQQIIPKMEKSRSHKVSILFKSKKINEHLQTVQNSAKDGRVGSEKKDDVYNKAIKAA